MNNFFNNRGFSLVSGILAMSLVAAAGLAFMRLAKNQTSFQAGFEARQNTNTFTEEVRTIMFNDKHCSKTLQMAGAKPKDGSDISNIYAENGDKMFEVGEKYQAESIKLIGIRVENFQATSGTDIGIADFILTISREKGSYTSKTISKKMSMEVELAADGTVANCNTLTSAVGNAGASRGYWVQDVNNQNLFYDVPSNVGVGNASPQGSLHIFRENALGPELVLDTAGDISATQYWIRGQRMWANYVVNNGTADWFGINRKDSTGNPTFFIIRGDTENIGMGRNMLEPQGSLHIYRPETTGAELILDTAGDISATQYWIRGQRVWANYVVNNGTADWFGINRKDSTGNPSYFVIRGDTKNIGMGRNMLDPQGSLHIYRSEVTGPELILDTAGDISATQYWVKGKRTWSNFVIQNSTYDRYGINYADSTGTTKTYFTILNDGKVGIGTTIPDDALDVVGNIDATGCFQNNNSGTIGGSCVSDGRLKESIDPLVGMLNDVLKLRPVEYVWRSDLYDIHKKSGKEIGLIAQEVESVFPDLVETKRDGYKRINYNVSLTIRVIQAIQEFFGIYQDDKKVLKDEIATLKKKNIDLENRILKLENLMANE